MIIIIVNGELAKYRKLSTEQKTHINSTYPVLNHSLAKALNLPERRELNPNKYISTLNQISEFSKTYLFATEFQSVLQIDTNGFIGVPEQKIFKTSYNSNTLVFGNNRTD
ncbi:MAG: hypothetical protein LBT04_01985, partial [Prevotellaceae bacterium]|nr:hypothetical protein [Prevotellaceae bacterium]